MYSGDPRSNLVMKRCIRLSSKRSKPGVYINNTETKPTGVYINNTETKRTDLQQEHVHINNDIIRIHDKFLKAIPIAVKAN